MLGYTEHSEYCGISIQSQVTSTECLLTTNKMWSWEFCRSNILNILTVLMFMSFTTVHHLWMLHLQTIMKWFNVTFRSYETWLDSFLKKRSCVTALQTFFFLDKRTNVMGSLTHSVVFFFSSDNPPHHCLCPTNSEELQSAAQHKSTEKREINKKSTDRSEVSKTL